MSNREANPSAHGGRVISGAFVLWTLIAFAAYPAVAARPSSTSVARVLVLNSYHKGYEWSDGIMRGIDEGLGAAGRPVDLWTEYMDAKRMRGGGHLEEFYRFCRAKYRGRRFDVVITADNAALDFLLGHRQDLWPGTPVVFCGINNYLPKEAEGEHGLTGVLERADFAGTLEVALRLHPEVNEVLGITTSSVTGEANREALAAAVAAFAPRVTFRAWVDLPLSEIEKRLEAMPQRAIVLALDALQDVGGRVVPTDERLRRISRASRGPVYTTWDFHLGHGAVGGRLVSSRAQGEIAAQLALRILDGEDPDSIPVVTDSANRYMFDYRELKRFGISEDRLPPGSTVVSRPRTLYSEYKAAVWLALLAFSALGGLTVLLLVNVGRRKRTEEELRRHRSGLEAAVAERTRELSETNTWLSREIAERTQTERALEESQERFRLFMGHFPGCAYIRGADRRLLFVNERFAECFGSTPDAWVGRRAEEVWPEAFAAQARREEEAALERGPTRSMVDVPLSDGVHVWLMHRFPLPTETDGPLVGGLAIDISERVNALAALQQSEAALRATFDHAAVGICHTDIEGRFLRVNTRFGDILGYTEAELRELALHDLVHPESRGQSREWYRRALAGEAETYSYEARYQRKDGTPIWGNLTVSLLRDDCGEPRYFIVVLEDVSERRLAEEERRQFEARLLQSQKMEAIGTLASGIAHDFNNLLQIISGYAELLRHRAEDDGQREGLGKIQVAADRGSSLVRSLLAFSRKEQSHLRPLDLNAEVETAVRMLEHTIPKMIRLETRLDPALCPIHGDAAQLQQVVMNLGTNARDALPQGGDLRIQTRNAEVDRDLATTTPGGRPGSFVLLEVTDTGHGIDPQVRQHIFEPFFTTKGVGQGTGLGLSTVYGIVQSHGGWITCESEPGKGSSFCIYLPALPPGSSAAAPAASAQAATGGFVGTETILIVDDEAVVLDVARASLEERGYRVLTARSGEEALEVYGARAGSVDLVVLDLGMPGMGGARALKALRELDPEVRIIVASGYAEERQAQELLAAGARAFVAKPYRLDRLLGVVREALAS